MELDQFKQFDDEQQDESPAKFNNKSGKKRFRNKWKKDDIRSKRKNKSKRQDSW